MKKIFLCFITISFLIFPSCEKDGNAFLNVGKKKGKRIVYKEFSETEKFNLPMDIDGDGLGDIDIYLSYICCHEREKTYYVYPLNGLEISAVKGNESFARKHVAGDAISNDLVWSQESLILCGATRGSTYGNSGSYYLSFRMGSKNQIYGWIHINVFANLFSHSFDIYDYAYFE